jgi:hypothetical protein
MSIEQPAMAAAPQTIEDIRTPGEGRWFLQWTAIIAGGLAAAAMSSIMISFAATVGLGVSSSSPTWRDTSVALWILSGIYLVLQAIVSFGFGGYIAGRARAPYAAASRANAIPADGGDTRDGLHGLMAWSSAVVLGAVLLALTGAAATRSSTSATNATAEPTTLSYEIDHLFRSARRPVNVDLTGERAEAGRILQTSSSHDGVSTDDRAYLIQQVGVTTGLAAPDAERRVDTAIADSKKAINRARSASIILAFSLATALLVGSVISWAAAVAGGRHRDGMPLPIWMSHSNRFAYRKPTPVV